MAEQVVYENLKSWVAEVAAGNRHPSDAASLIYESFADGSISGAQFNDLLERLKNSGRC